MKLKVLLASILAALGIGIKAPGRFVGRRKVRDSYPPVWANNLSAIPYRMSAGFPGDVNRAHPASIEPCLLDPTNPPPYAGFPVLVNTSANSVRQLLSGDTAVTEIYGVTVRAFPFQQSTTSAAYGSIAFGPSPLQANQPCDVIRSGYILTQLPTGSSAVTKGGAVFVWIAASTGNHIQGGFEASASSGNTIALDATRITFNGPADANGVVEISIAG
jgi:hypothetical protein